MLIRWLAGRCRRWRLSFRVPEIAPLHRRRACHGWELPLLPRLTGLVDENPDVAHMCGLPLSSARLNFAVLTRALVAARCPVKGERPWVAHVQDDLDLDSRYRCCTRTADECAILRWTSRATVSPRITWIAGARSMSRPVGPSAT